MIKSSREKGAVFLFAAILLPGLLLLIFACIQLVNGMGEAVWNYYRGIQTVQQMQSNIPSEQGAYDAAAWVSILNGFADAKAEDGRQTLSKGEIEFSYSVSTEPHTVSAYFKRELPLLAGFFSNVFSTLGLVQLNTEAQLSGSSYDAAALLAVDVSDSMRGPAPTGTMPSIIDNVFDRYQIPKYPVGASWGLCCWPINVGDTTMGDRCTLEQRKLCYEYRQKLPGYYSDPPTPVWLSYYKQRPGPEIRPFPFSPSTFDPMFPDPSPNPGPYFMLGDEEKKVVAPGRHAWEYYNPSRDYRTYSPVGDNLLVCGSTFTGSNVCEPGHPSFPCFPLGPNPVWGQFAMNRPGYRIVDYLTEDPSDPSNANRSCGFTTQPCQRSPIRYITDRFCVLPWAISRDWTTAEESAACIGGGAPNEVPLPGGCGTQLGALYYHMSDFWESYKRLVQAFFISAADLVNITNLSVFAGPIAAGNIANPIYGSNPPQRLGGNMTIFDGVRDGGHPFKREIDQELLDLRGRVVQNNTGGQTRVSGNLNYLPGFRRVSGLLPHLPREQFPLSNPAPGASVAVLAGGTAYQGFRAFSPVQHPLYPYVNNPLPYAPSPPPEGRCGTWQGDTVAFTPNRAEGSGYGLPLVGDVWGPNPSRFFHPPGDMQLSNILISLNKPLDATWREFDNANSPGIFSWPNLKAIDYQTGEQLNPPQDYVVENVNTFAGCGLNYISPTMGGTDHWAVFEEIRKATNDLKVARAPAGVSKYEETTPVIGVVFTDGKPNLPCSNDVLIRNGWDDELTCNPIPFGNISSPGSHMYQINEELKEFKKFKNTFVVVLFMVSNPALLADAEFQAFKSLFENDPEGKSAFLYFVFTDTADFQEKFARSMEIIKALIVGITKFV